MGPLEIDLWQVYEVCGWCLSYQRTSTPNIDSIQLKAKELQSKMYFTRTHWIHKIGSLCGGTWTTFSSWKKSISANWESLVGSYEDSGYDPIRMPVGIIDLFQYPVTCNLVVRDWNSPIQVSSPNELCNFIRIMIDGICFSTRSYNRTPWGESPSFTHHEWQWEIDQIIPHQTLLWYTEEIYLRCNNAFHSQSIPLTSVFTHAFWGTNFVQNVSIRLKSKWCLERMFLVDKR